MTAASGLAIATRLAAAERRFREHSPPTPLTRSPFLIDGNLAAATLAGAVRLREEIAGMTIVVATGANLALADLARALEARQ